ncbi:hypothetical protein ACFOLJ_11850 [Rugamonas sp. CCM 8940]|uniref:hypothetical protein n=1 Tax=Rugamonas sp. CCM 8940 TaxID=2765359 RepID=UPI0018F33963|nr:hypothetical protein [Rugamonas sp. CCM 8940]MBJ7311566.1 hypothetical protein [Rugamonas sp. CCM 8940]
MKFSTLRASAALALILALAGCGGKASFDVSGTVIGLSNPGLVLTMGGNDDVNVAPAAGTVNFTFGRRLSYGDAYEIRVKQDPVHMTCSAYRGTSGTAGQTTNIAAIFNCTKNAYMVTGWVTGLTAQVATTDPQLVLINGSTGGQVTIAAATNGSTNPTFGFGPVEQGVAYGITVQTQPKGQFCSVVNGSGLMGDAIVSNVQVSCKAQ